jgi:hypothetical protein
MAFMDLALAAIPIHMIWGLQMPLKRKLAIGSLLSTGIVCVVAHSHFTGLADSLVRSLWPL